MASTREKLSGDIKSLEDVKNTMQVRLPCVFLVVEEGVST